MTSTTDANSAGLANIGQESDADANAERSKDGITPWRERIQQSSNLSREIRGGNFVQIATVDADGCPCCRTVVFRGFVKFKSNAINEAMRMITDARSEKVSHVRRSPACEMVWWFAKSSEQYRIAGELQLIGPESDGELQEARKDQWVKLSDLAREQFWWDSPGVPYSGEQSPPKGGRGTDGEILPPPDTFLLMLLWPQKVKYLRLTDNFSQVDMLEQSSKTWKATRVNP